MITDKGTACADRLLKLAIVLLSLFCLEVPLAGADLRTITVGVYENAPKVFTSEDGKPSGIFIDVIEQIAKMEGWNLRYVPGTWAEGLDRLAKGQIDLMTDVAYTTEREKSYSFHKIPVLSVWSQVYAPKGSGIQSILDLNGKRIIALEQTIQLETFKRLTSSFGLKITLIPVPDYKTGFDMVVKRKADAGVTNRFYGLMHARKLGLEDTPVMFDPAPFFFAATKGDPKQLLDVIDSRLSALKEDPQSAYYASLKRWTSEEVTFKLPAWLKILSLIVGVALVISAGGSFLLRHQVSARTRELKQMNQELEQRIAERMASEKALRESERRYKLLFESAGDAIFLMREELFVDCNAMTLKVFKCSREDIIGQTPYRFSPPFQADGRDSKSKALELIGNALDGIPQVFEWKHQTADGTPFDAEVNLNRVELSSGMHIQAIVRDITGRKRAEAELEKHRLHLEEMVEARTVELSSANKKLKELDKLKSMFIASMSHELRTPLNSIIGFTGMTLQGMSGELNDEQKDNLTRAYFSAKHLLNLITDVIDISKIEAGRVEAYPEEFPLRAIVDDAVATVEPQLKEKGLVLETHLPPDTSLNTDRKRLLQCMINLLSNAVKFTESGRITVSSRVTDNQVSLSVSDTGIGIAEKDLPRLFEAFERLETHLRVKAGGTGLGLYLTRKLVTDILRGSVSIDSTEGQGSTFTITIPRDISAAQRT